MLKQREASIHGQDVGSVSYHYYSSVFDRCLKFVDVLMFLTIEGNEIYPLQFR